MRTVMDQMGRIVRVPTAPRRIISLVPSQTELLFDLGVADRVVGVTKFCIHPAEARRATQVIGGTKQFDFSKIDALNPDLILGNKEENYADGIAALAEKYPVWLSDISTLAEALTMIRTVGELVNCASRADEMAREIAAQFQMLATEISSVDAAPVPVAYLIWRNPWMAAGGNTFIDEMLRAAGLRNVFGDRPRYPVLSEADFEAARPQYILLSSEPYPFKARHLAEAAALGLGAKSVIVDGELFSWYGSRLRATPDYFRALRLELRGA